MNNTPVPIGSQPLQMTNPETQVLMSLPMYAPGQSGEYSFDNKYTGLLKMVVTPCQKVFLDTFMANKTYILECYKPVLF